MCKQVEDIIFVLGELHVEALYFLGVSLGLGQNLDCVGLEFRGEGVEGVDEEYFHDVIIQLL